MKYAATRIKNGALLGTSTAAAAALAINAATLVTQPRHANTTRPFGRG